MNEMENAAADLVTAGREAEGVVMPEVLKDLENRFTHHAPKGNQSERYEAFRAMAKVLANSIVRFAPKSREQSLALTHLEEVIFWTNAAIARNE